MKSWKVSAILSAMVAAGVGIAMVATNPGEEAYRNYATQRLTQYLQEKECVKLDNSFRDLCKLLEQRQGQNILKRLVAENTQRQNYGLLSIYQTTFSTEDVVPSFLQNLLSLPTISYHTETVGLFGTFQTYKAERQD